MGEDPLAGGLLLLYGLHPASLEKRVEAALEQVRPALGQHRGNVELLGIEDGTVSLRLQGTCHGCPSSTSTFRQLIEAAIHERAPEVERIKVDGLVSK
jgi:Fe-S cluster biogenesis protein NfuA